MCLIAGYKNAKIAFLVDSVSEIIEVSAEDITEAPEIIKSTGESFINRIARWKNKIIILPEMEAILNREEKLQIERLSKKK